MKDCPVCKRPGLADGLQHCPQCNANLECFDLLDALQEPQTSGGRASALVNGKRALLTALLTILPLVALGLAGGHYLGARIDGLAAALAGPEGPSRRAWSRSLIATQALATGLADVERQIARVGDRQASAGTFWNELRLGERLSTIEQRIQGLEKGVADLGHQQHATRTKVTVGASKPSSLSGSPAAAPNIPASDFAEYIPLPDETLWSIARRFYGKGIYYPILLEDNPRLAVHGSRDGRGIRIARERRQAWERYRRLVVTRDGRTLFHYRVKAGDSWRSLAHAFYGDERRTAELAELNQATEGVEPPPAGKRVLIPLD